MSMIKNYEHKIASHCESGSVRNLLNYAGFNITEPLSFGIGTGVVFAYMFFIKGVGGFPITAIRMPMGAVINNVSNRLNIRFYKKKFRSPDEAMKIANQKIDAGIPVALCVDLFYMKYLPKLMQIHVPFHFIILIGRDETHYFISDPYFNGIAKLTYEEIRLAWNTHSLIAKDNYLAHVDDKVKPLNWEKALRTAIKSTCNNIILGPGVRKIFSLFGAEGIRLFAREMLKWPERYKGLPLREGMLYTPTIFEEQGTGGGAFRLIYGAFLQEAADILNSKALKEKAFEMIENGNQWKEASRELIRVAKELPIKTVEYESWYEKNKSRLQDGLKRVSNLFMQRADVEMKIFTDIAKIIRQ